MTVYLSTVIENGPTGSHLLLDRLLFLTRLYPLLVLYSRFLGNGLISVW